MVDKVVSEIDSLSSILLLVMPIQIDCPGDDITAHKVDRNRMIYP